MNKSESKELSANKRVSARRATTESDLPLADHTATIARRVYARRANPEPDPGAAAGQLAQSDERGGAAASEGLALAGGDLAESEASTRDGVTDASAGAEQASTGDGIAFSGAGSVFDGSASANADATPSALQPSAAASSVPPPRARARRPRAKQASKVMKPPAAAESRPLAAAESSGAQLSAAHFSTALNQGRATRAGMQEPSREATQEGSSASLRALSMVSAQDAPAGIVEGARWGAGLQAADDAPPPSLDHDDFADDFGLDAQYESKLRPWLDSLCERHFHVELFGAENIPAHGRALLVANHSRASVWDGILLRAALRSHHPAGRVPRWLVDDQQFHAPFLGTVVNRLGAVRACQENAERLLLREELVAVFPEGSKATTRPYEQRYRLQRFGRGGYVKLALRTGTPVFPVAIVATEHEGAVWRNRLANASRVLSAPFVALRPDFSRVGMLGVPPISARIRIYVGASIAEISRHDASGTQDDGLVHELNECVRSAVQNLVNASLHASANPLC